MNRPAANAVQDELPLASVLSHAVFPGRSTLYVSEVAKALSIEPRQVIDLILCGDIEAVSISATREGSAKNSTQMDGAERARVPRTHWRVTVSGYDFFLRKRSNQNLQ